MKNLFLFMVMFCILFTFQPYVFAWDQSACANNPHPSDWGMCLGKMEPGDYQAFRDFYYSPAHDTVYWTSPLPEDMGHSLPEATPSPINVNWATIRNRIAPADVYVFGATGGDSSLMFSGTAYTTMIPAIWKFQLQEDNQWGTAGMIGYHIDWVMNPVCAELCDENGCPFDGMTDDCVYDFYPDGNPIPPGESYCQPVEVVAADGTICGWEWWDEDANNGAGGPGAFWNLYQGVLMEGTAGVPLTTKNVESVTWLNKPNGAESVTVKESPREIYNYMKYDTKQNMIFSPDGFSDGGITCYTHGFSVKAPIGLQRYEIKLETGESQVIECDVVSDRQMPIVPATRTETFSRVAGKSGKVIALDTYEVPNITARETIDEDGQTRLLVQWAEPDLAMTFSEYMKDVRLRVYIGDGWMGAPLVNGNPLAHFLWIDLPVQSGSLVVPPAEYADLKAKVNGTIYISGQYREQYNGFHNRGYWGYITLP